jgi:erythronate-4-phosphate dehydrogenase
MHILVDANLPRAEELCRIVCAGLPLTVSHFSERQPSAAQLAEAEVLWVRSVTRVDAALLRQAPKLQWVASGTIGTEHIDEIALAAAGVAFSHTPGVNAQAVGDYVLSAVAALSLAQDALPAGEVAIIGAGHTGRAAGARLAALGLSVHYYDPLLCGSGHRHDLAVHDDWQRVLQSTVISCHVPLTQQGNYATYHLFDDDSLAQLPADCWLINTSRGAVVSETAVRNAIVRGQRLRWVFDVWEFEPQVPLDLLPHIALATAHIAGHSVAGKVGASWQLAQQLRQRLGSTVELPCLHQLVRAWQLPTSSLASRPADWQGLASAVLALYDIRVDDQLLRSHGVTASGFDALRRNYHPRVELISAGLPLFADGNIHVSAL